MGAVTLILGIIILLLILGVVPVVLGILVTPWIHRENADSVTFNYIVGILIMLCLMQLFSVPMTLAKVHFSKLVFWYNVVLAVLVVCALCLRHKALKKSILGAVERIRSAGKIWIFAIAAIYIPIVILNFYTPFIYGDDKTYLTMVNDMISSDTLYLVDTITGEMLTWVSAKYALSSYWTFLAYLAKMTGIHPLILCKTILCYFIIPMYYAVQMLLASWLFRNDKRKMAVYLLFVNLVSVFGGFSNYTITYRLLTWIWQSKAFLALIVMPFLFYFANLIFEKKTKVPEYILLAVTIVAACSTTLTGAGLAVAMVAALALLYAIKRKRFGILIGTGIACSPALFLLVVYLKYDIIVSAVNRFLF